MVLDRGRTLGLAAMAAAVVVSAVLVPTRPWQLHLVGWAVAAAVGLGGYGSYRTHEARASARPRFRNPVGLGRVVATTALALFLLAGAHGFLLATEVAKL